jgi:hypothetical protein
MKKAHLSFLLLSGFLFACNKSTSDTASISLTSSTTSVAVGQTVTVTANTSANTVSWTVTPATAVSKTYNVTTEKTNYFTFSQPGDYIVGVRARSLSLDSIHHCNPDDSLGHHVPDSLWNHHIDSLWVGHGFHEGGCKNGKDSASIHISVH